MTREQKLALIMGFALALVVGVLVSDHLSKASRDGSLNTDGLDGALARETQREVNPLLVNRGALDETYATPERGFFEQVRDEFERAADDVGTLPRALKTTDDRADDNTVDRAGIPEIEMGKSTPTIDRPEPARIYRVKPEDSLWAIAQREYGDGALHERLALYNHDRIGAGGTIRTGASLLIPSKDVLLRYERGDDRLVGDGARRESRPAPERGPATRAYVVKKGETLSEICQRELGSGKRWREVVELNDGAIPENGSVRVDQRILLPAD
ncbi:MAG: hypothetical protein Tsb0013_23620 [Phycisphaerales bacterium]